MGMNPERKAQWVAALRSGEFPQGAQELKTAEGEFCCLGVACELALREGVLDFEYLPDPNSVDDESKRFYGNLDEADIDSTPLMSWSDLPLSAQNWLGLPYADPAVLVTDTHPKFSDLVGWTREGDANVPLKVSILNDSGFTFDEIADLIEEQL